MLFLIKVGQDELELNANISQIWDDLFKEARQVDLSLADVKKSFSVVRHSQHGKKVTYCPSQFFKVLHSSFFFFTLH